MSLLKSISKEEATGEVGKIYNLLEERANFIPNVVKFHSTSPELFTKFMSITNHFIDHPTLDPVTVSYIRLLISARENGEYCKRLQTLVLKSYKISSEDIFIALHNYRDINLDKKRKLLISFVMDMMYDNLSNKITDLNLLRKLGWSDKDIYEASMIAAIQKGMVKLINNFEVEFDY